MVTGQGKTHRNRAQARAKAATVDLRGWLLAGALGLGTVFAAQSLRAETITSHGISPFGELDLPADFTHLPYANPDAPKGGEISMGVFGGFDSMNPFTVKGRGAAGSTMMLETILVGNSDEIGASYCLLCTTMEYPEDRSWVIFNLRDDVKFSDGSPMTAEDVVFSYETFRDKGLSDFRTILGQQVEGAEALSPHQVTFTFKPGVPTRDLPASVGGLNVFSKKQFETENIDLEDSRLKPFIGTGAYVSDKIDAGRSVTYRRNPDYWGKDHPMMRGRYNFDRIRYEYFSDNNAEFEAFKAGIYTFRTENVARQWAEQYNFPAVTNGAVKREALPSGAKATGQAFIFNLRREKWQDPKVRQAISLMFNFEWLNKAQFFGLYSRVNSFWENSTMAAEGVPSPEEIAILQPLVDEGLLQANILTDAPLMQPVSSVDRQLDRARLREASRLLDEAGWEPGTDGIRRNAKGETLSFEILEDNPDWERIIAPFVENLRALGVDAKMTLIDQAQYEVRTRNPAYDFDLVGFFTLTNYISGDDLKQVYGSETADISVFNLGGLRSPAVDRLIDVVMATNTLEDLTVATHALDRVLRAEGYRIPMWFNNQHWVAYYDMYEHPEALPTYELGVLANWWYNAEKAEALKARGALR